MTQVYEPNGGLQPVVRMIGTWASRLGCLTAAEIAYNRGAWKLSAGDAELRFHDQATAIRAAAELAKRVGGVWLVDIYPDTHTVYMQPYEPAIDSGLLENCIEELTYLIGA